MIFFQVLNLPLLIDQLAFLILQFLLCNNPIIVYSFPLLLEIGKQLLLLFVSLLELSQLLTHGKLNRWAGTLNYSDSVSLTLLA